MNESELRSLLPPERRLPADRRSDIQEQLMATIHEESHAPAADSSPRRGRSRRRIIGGAVGAAVVLGVTTAAAATVMNRSQPDPEQAAQVNENTAVEAQEIHLPGWRQELDAENVTCAYATPDPSDPTMSLTVDSTASEFPLEERLTAQHLADECASGTDGAQAGTPAEAPTVCVTEGTVPRPTVLVAGGTCEDFAGSAVVEGDLVPLTDAHLDEINRLRAIEVAILAVPNDDACPSFDEAEEWAESQIEHADVDLQLTDEAPEPGNCYWPYVYWEHRLEDDTAAELDDPNNGGMVWIQPTGPQGPAE